MPVPGFKLTLSGLPDNFSEVDNSLRININGSLDTQDNWKSSSYHMLLLVLDQNSMMITDASVTSDVEGNFFYDFDLPKYFDLNSTVIYGLVPPVLASGFSEFSFESVSVVNENVNTLLTFNTPLSVTTLDLTEEGVFEGLLSEVDSSLSDIYSLERECDDFDDDKHYMMFAPLQILQDGECNFIFN